MVSFNSKSQAFISAVLTQKRLGKNMSFLVMKLRYEIMSTYRHRNELRHENAGCYESDLRQHQNKTWKKGK